MSAWQAPIMPWSITMENAFLVPQDALHAQAVIHTRNARLAPKDTTSSIMDATPPVLPPIGIT